MQEAIDELGYSPNRAARNLRTRASHLIGLRFAPAQEGTANATMDRFVHSLVETSREAGYHVLLFAGDREDPLAGYDDLLRSTAVDAFVVTDTYLGNPQAAWLEERRAPFVAFGRPGTSPGFPIHAGTDPARAPDVEGRPGDGRAGGHVAGCHPWENLTQNKRSKFEQRTVTILVPSTCCLVGTLVAHRSLVFLQWRAPSASDFTLRGANRQNVEKGRVHSVATRPGLVSTRSRCAGIAGGNRLPLPVALWFIGAAVFGLVLAYGIMRNRSRPARRSTLPNKQRRKLTPRKTATGLATDDDRSALVIGLQLLNCCPVSVSLADAAGIHDRYACRPPLEKANELGATESCC